MKTSERILMVSLTLFNTHGEPNVSSVDIANEMDISPGNLYYHFKGKDTIISSLFEMYRQRMSKILLAPNKEDLSLDDFFYYLLMILETSNLFIFLYRNPTELSEKYPQVAKGLNRMLSTKKKVFQQCIESFSKQQKLFGDAAQQQQMVELIGLVCTQSPNYHLMLGEDITEGNYVYGSLAIILFALAPYMNIDKEVYQDLYQSITSQQLKSV